MSGLLRYGVDKELLPRMPVILPNPSRQAHFFDDANLLSLSCGLSLFPLTFRTVIQHSPAVNRLPRQIFYTSRSLLNPVQQSELIRVRRGGGVPRFSQSCISSCLPCLRCPSLPIPLYLLEDGGGRD